MALALVGVRTASAAGIDLGGQQILVGEDESQGCSSSTVGIDYDVAYDAALQGYGVSAAELSGLGACQGQDVVVTLSGPGGVALAELSAVVGGSEMTVAVPATTPVPAEQLTGVSITLSSEAGV
ncbi:hypothetical protein ICW40_13360 [Actinotalea ferrariae]|uniref:hypothetical protein n=1 Tax=Actinotalea ferrariae TaxID=1386098 RepID=UPI001C8C504A|nr:hypothetical protein [Actinotalea ferrariae]MBX9245790.1 hypothetical protein [Actinotalea ferrariae]